jgi:riboflavin biosynthesis pyrimidine reductase
VIDDIDLALRRLVQARGFATVYAIAGPEVLRTLIDADLLDRLYLTFALKLLAGNDFATLLRGPALEPPLQFELHQLYFATAGAANSPQIFASFNRSRN